MIPTELMKVEAFRIVGFGFDASSNTAHFDYAFDDTHQFRETVEFGGAPLGPGAGPGMEAALRLVHLAAGVSYYKAAAPARIVVETGPLTRAEEGLVRDLYDKGLREFAVANELAVPLGFELTAGPGLFGGGKGGGPGGVNRSRLPEPGSPCQSAAGRTRSCWWRLSKRRSSPRSARAFWS